MEFDERPMDGEMMDKDMDDYDMDKDMDMGKGGMGMMDKMMGGPEALMMMIGMTAIKTGLKLTRWADADVLTQYTTDTSMWANASMVEVYGNFVLSTVAILTHVAAVFTEDPMFKEAFMVSVMLGHAVFMVANILRMVQLDSAFTVINDDASASGDVTDARAVVEGVKLDMAVSTAHEAMEMLALQKAMAGMKGGKRGDKDWSSSEGSMGEDSEETAPEDETDFEGEMDM